METLSTIKSKGVMTAISTNRTNSMPYIMERFELEPYFDMVVTALDVERPKPDPESVNLILGRPARAAGRDALRGGLGDRPRHGPVIGRHVRGVRKNRAISTGILIREPIAILRFLSNGGPPRHTPSCV